MHGLNKTFTFIAQQTKLKQNERKILPNNSRLSGVEPGDEFDQKFVQ